MRINMKEVMEAKNTITSSRNKLQAEINRAKSDWKIVQRSNALSGKVKTAINGEIDNYQIPMLTNYYDLLHTLSKEMEKTISDFKASVKENSESAIIDTEALNEAKGKFTTPLSDFAKLDMKIRNIYSSVEHIVPVSAPSNQFNKKMEEAKKVLTETLKGMDTFNGRKVGSIVKDKLAQQSSKIAQVGGLSYSNPKSLAIFTDKTFKNEIKEFHKIVRKEEKLDFKQEHPLLAAMNGNLTEADLQELDQLINSSLAGSIKEGKRWAKHVKNLYISSRIKRMSDGTLVIKKAGKWLSKFDKLTGIDKYMRMGKDFTRLSTSGGLKQFTDLGDSLLDKLKLVDKNVVLKGSKQAFKESVKGIGKGTLKSAGEALKKGASFGINGVVKDAKALVNAKGAGKIVPGLNVALGAVDVVQGISKSEQLARKDGLKGHEITASKVGGALVDVGKVAVTTAAIGAAGAVAGFFGAPVVGVVLTGIAVSGAINYADKKWKVTNSLKSGINSMVKGVSGWFK
ncbi:T7SS effector LXG polymorphic toxin [Enterococcus faecalis]|uniref:T7SS effector LXG polymorphic toxin n=1 Tax=Enterococcus faecalis TaxID=1351 RepID=UPI0019297280|nr:T7SS effector LXG polymorphic toxin [Enterococcus faecalis]MDN3139669.1 T7SS effector LXG polymorphic toxin [Enterococcus faecalis]